jgi:hypothetical protein
MPQSFASEPVGDSIAKVNDEVAVGEDLNFQRTWWRFENMVWVIFTLILALDLLGVFGRGWLAKQERKADDGSIDVKYERIQRTSTPSIITVEFGQSAIQNGKAQLYVSESLVKELAAQRVVPSPEATIVGNGGLTYVFPASGVPASVEFALEPTGPGVRHFVIQVPGAQPIHADVVVMP